ncbi:citrate synthase/methylcitrate synthase [Halegenticoccus tardaugens]|uniref:citrate synthase/methylcitrate synthase n=1 Tax=Halegenticoccus tardaugens TaxID=2071624 RepID=UPI00100A3F29|nr:citrate synthase/methylcitrate synthase [Halegenticoccus tardaugens]
MGTDELRAGLENVVVAETRLSSVDGEAGELLVAGYPIEELAPNASFEETLYLLRNGRLPTADELDDFREKLASRRSIPDATIDLLRAAAEDDGQSAMDALRMGAATLSLGAADGRGGEGEREREDESGPVGGDPDRDSLSLVAAFPTVVAAYWRLRSGEEPVDPRPDLRHAANYLRMLTGELPTEAETWGLETYLNAVVDHGLNASTFTARTIASTESDLVSAITGAVGALKGPLHGGAPGPVLAMLLDVDESGDAEGYLREKLDAGERIMGFGHRVYRVRDPRAAVLSDAAERFYAAESGGDEAFFESARTFEGTAVDLLAEYKPGRNLETNVEFYTAVLLHGVGVPQELFSATFGVARVGGWTAHCLEQLDDNRLIRPRSRYVGARGREWTPIEDR